MHSKYKMTCVLRGAVFEWVIEDPIDMSALVEVRWLQTGVQSAGVFGMDK